MSESSSTSSGSGQGGPGGGAQSAPGGREQSAPGGSAQSGAGGQGSTWYEEFKVSGDNLVAKVRELIREGNVRRVYVKNEKGETLIEIPLTAGVAVTAVAAAFAPVLVAVGAIAALVTQATIGVERRQAPESADRATDESGPAGELPAS